MNTLLAGFTASVVDYGVSSGLDRAALLKTAGIREDELQRPDGRITPAQSTAVWNTLIEQLDDPDLGLHIGARAPHPKRFGLMGYLTRAASTLRDAYASVAKFHRTLGLRSALLEETADTASLVFRVLDRGPAVARHTAEATMVIVLVLAQRTTSRRIVPRRVAFEHARPKSIAEHERLFGCPLVFGQPTTRLELDRATLDAPLLKADPALETFLSDLAGQHDQLLTGSNDLVTRVEHVIRSALPKAPTLGSVGRSLALSPRTLQRRLKSEGRSFNALVDGVRQQLATGLLEHGHTVREAAERVGFRDANAFRRAFKRWTKRAPSAFRAEHRA